jgi:hypothetical protein
MPMVQEQLQDVGFKMDMQIIDHTTFHNQRDRDLNTLTKFALLLRSSGSDAQLRLVGWLLRVC